MEERLGAKRLLSPEGEFHGGYGRREPWRALRTDLGVEACLD